MALDKYPWSEKYGWLSDKFGVSWQVSLGKLSDVGQKITPSLLFTQDHFGKAEEAIGFYTSVFKNSSVDGILKWPEEQGKELAGKVQHAQVVLDGNKMMLMESLGHQFTFSEGVSLTIYCDSQEEVDYYWERLGEGGDEKAQQCGWLKDKYGLSWQVIPAVLIEMLNDADKRKSQKVMEAMLQMKKIDIAELHRAAVAE